MHPAAKDLAGPAEWFAAIGETTRLTILRTLATDEKTVTQLAATCQVEIVNVSHHLKLLRDAGLVTSVKEGRNVIYSLAGARTKGATLEMSHASGLKVSIPLS